MLLSLQLSVNISISITKKKQKYRISEPTKKNMRHFNQCKHEIWRKQWFNLLHCPLALATPLTKCIFGVLAGTKLSTSTGHPLTLGSNLAEIVFAVAVVSVWWMTTQTHTHTQKHGKTGPHEFSSVYKRLIELNTSFRKYSLPSKPAFPLLVERNEIQTNWPNCLPFSGKDELK